MTNTPDVKPAGTGDSTAEIQSLLGEIRTGWGAINNLPAEFKTMRETYDILARDVKEVRRTLASRLERPAPRPPGVVSDSCARAVASAFILHCARSDMLEALSSVPAHRDAILAIARDTLNVSTRAALTGSEIPLPAQYGSEIRELISDFGVVRNRMARYPIGMGTAKPARMGLRPSFSSIAMSGAFPEKSPSFEFASLESHKIGGIVRLPRELDEQSIVPLGQFLSRYGAVEFARAEDTWGFLADGTGAYESVKGVVKIARDNTKTVVLAAGKTKPSDATLDDFRALRLTVNKAALSGRISAYYLDTTWEARLPAFRSAAEPNVYQRLPDGSAIRFCKGICVNGFFGFYFLFFVISGTFSSELKRAGGEL